ncbi:MAG: Gx transporter family protein [Desulfitobacteriaceae bacterium]|nr:Gx transporter family protein [Desulfitobacteriaceae bacterium]
MFNTRRIAIIAMFVALATVLNIVERSIIIPGAHPGVKLGLANVITLLSILMLGSRDAFLVVAVRCFMGAFIGGNPVGFLFSFTGGMLSTLVMVIMWNYFRKLISIVNISMIGAVCHNIGQLFIAALLARSFHVYVFLPVLMISAVITGYIVGVLTKQVHKSLIARNIKIWTENQDRGHNTQFL